MDSSEHAQWQARMQRLRGRLYLEDGAIEPWQLTSDGRHQLARDDKSWHLLSLDHDEVVGCARLQLYPPTAPFSELGVSTSALAHSPEYGLLLREAVAAEQHRAASDGLWYAEAAGWALVPELRHTTEALQIALRTFAVAQSLGGCLGLSTATVRHRSAAILSRLGGGPLLGRQGPLPRYYDPQYQCEMEIVRFDSRRPNPKYQALVDRIQAELPAAPIFGVQADLSALNTALSPPNGHPTFIGSASPDAADVSR